MSQRTGIFFIFLCMAHSAEAAPTSVTIDATPNPARYGAPVTLTASVDPVSATGLVTFYQDVSFIGTAPVSGGTASLTTVQLAPGARRVKAFYGGDTAFHPSVSGPIRMTVNAAPAQGFDRIMTPLDASLQSSLLAAGDFNADGKLDVAGADNYARVVRIFLGKGDGAFIKGGVYTFGSSTGFMVSADLNGDGTTDLAVAAPEQSLVWIFPGNGDGSFGSAMSLASGGPTTHLVAADLNRDGLVDLALSNPYGSAANVSVLFNKGAGLFTAPVLFPLKPSTGALAVADFNLDGFPDLAAASGREGFEILLGKEGGTFEQLSTNPTFPSDLRALATGDFQNDGNPDLLISHYGGISMLAGNGDGTFAEPVLFDQIRGSYQLTVMDVNGDGLDDIVAATDISSISGITSSFAVLSGNGDRIFTLNPYTNRTPSSGFLIAGDFNGDSRVDIIQSLPYLTVFPALGPTDLAVVIEHSGNFQQGQIGRTFTVTVHNDGPSPTATEVRVAFRLPEGMSMASIAGLGWSCFSENCARLDALNPGESYPPITLRVNVAVTAPPFLAAAAIVSVQGMSDGNLTNNEASDLTVVLQNQKIVFGRLPDRVAGGDPFPVSATATSGLPVTFRAEGECSIDGSTVTIVSAGGCAITASQPGDALFFPAADVVRSFVIGSAPTSVTLNSSPNPSIAGAPVTLIAKVDPANAGGAVTFYDGSTIIGTASLNEGTAALTVHLHQTGLRRLSARYRGSASYIAAISAPVPQTVTASPGFRYGQSMLPVFLTASLAEPAIGDFNGDGIPDIATATTRLVKVFPGAGGGAFGAERDSAGHPFSYPPKRAVAADFDGDGNLDLAIAGLGSNPQPAYSLSIYSGKGDGTFRAAASYPASSASLTVADFNSDGLTDLAIASPKTGKVILFLSKAGGEFDPAIEYAVGSPAAGMVLTTADVNQDGAVDIVAAWDVSSSAETQVNILLGNNDGTFALSPAACLDRVPGGYTADPGAMIAADLNGDGLPDLVIQGGFSYGIDRCSLAVFIGAGGGEFQPPVHYPCSRTSAVSANGSPAGLVSGDFTGDGKADIAALYVYVSGFVQIFPGNGDGTLQASAVHESADFRLPGGIAAADLNGDGKLDLASAMPSGVYVLTANPAPFLRAAITHNNDVSVGNGVRYTTTISNAGNALRTASMVSVSLSPPDGARVISITAPGWNCSANTCTRADVLDPGAAYPPISMLVDLSYVSQNSPPARVVVSGGGSPPSEAMDIMGRQP
ncbi:MAG: VCBS repeat-containing protein [Bryobacterales bacterium]|nr:VCBS repeat-containing protein [Bryobacterales bacterium]